MGNVTEETVQILKKLKSLRDMKKCNNITKSTIHFSIDESEDILLESQALTALLFDLWTYIANFVFSKLQIMVIFKLAGITFSQS